MRLSLSICWSVRLTVLLPSLTDQVAIIKRKLQLMLDGCEIFLDVDNLDDVSHVEYHVLRRSILK